MGLPSPGPVPEHSWVPALGTTGISVPGFAPHSPTAGMSPKGPYLARQVFPCVASLWVAAAHKILCETQLSLKDGPGERAQ